jgi:large subunit ribosomal protein L17
MRHGKKVNHLSRKSGHRKAMLSNMASSLIMHKRIETTLAKAKALRKYVEPLITRSKDDSTHSRRMTFRYLRDKFAVTELFDTVAAKVGDRPGGYTRIIRIGNRAGDNAEMCMMELVDFNDTYTQTKAKSETTTKKRRTRRGGSAKTSETAVAVETQVEEPVEKAEEVVEETTTDTVEEVVETKEEIKEATKEVAENIENKTDETESVNDGKEEDSETKDEDKEEKNKSE